MAVAFVGHIAVVWWTILGVDEAGASTVISLEEGGKASERRGVDGLLEIPAPFASGCVPDFVRPFRDGHNSLGW